MNAPKDPMRGIAALDSIRVRIAMIAAEKIRAGVPAERAVAEASAQFHSERRARSESAPARSGVKPR